MAAPGNFKKYLPHTRWLYAVPGYVLPFAGTSLFVFLLASFIPFFHTGSGYYVYFLVTAALLTLGMVSSTVVAFVAGYLFGMWSMPGLVLSYLVASWGGYYLAGSVLGQKLIDGLSENNRFQQFKNKAEGAGLTFVAVSRMSPVLPFPAANLAFACLRFPLVKYLIGSMLGMLPRTLAAVYFGTGAYNYAASGEVPELKVITGVFLVLSLLYFYTLIKKSRTGK